MKKYFIYTIVFLTIILAVISTKIIFEHESNLRKLPVIGQVKPFVLVNHKGEEFGMKNLFGKVWVANFFFTSCGDICPVMSSNMASLSRTFEKVPGVEFVSISVNPENDSPGILAQYLRKYPKIASNWKLLTGDRTLIKDLALNSFKLGSVEEPVFHSDKFALVDRSGYIRNYYDGTDREQVNQLFIDANELLKERK